MMVRCRQCFARVVPVLIAVVWMGCGSETTDSSSPAGKLGRPGVSLPALVDAAMERPPEQDALPVLDRLRKPIRVETTPRENRHNPGQIDTLRTFHYAGLQFTVYDVAGDPKEIMQGLVVTDSAYATEAGGRLGMNRQQIRAALGAPDVVEDGAFVYRLSDVTPSELRIAFEAETAARMEWNFYVD